MVHSIRGRIVVALFACLLAPAGQAAGGVPGDHELEAQGARIGAIIVRPQEIFAPDENKALFRLADRLHRDTRESTIRAQLLFAEGDLYSRRILDETERALRELRFVREPRIEPVAWRDGVVDVEVTTHDVWTMNPGLSYGRAGGANDTSLAFEELNLFGYGKQLAVGYGHDVDRSSYSLRWHDPNLLGTRWTSSLSLTDSDDGDGYLVALERPFYALDSHWAAGLAASRSRGTDTVYSLGEEVAEYARDLQSVDAYYSWSAGLQQGWTRRWGGGMRRDQSTFSLLDGSAPPSSLPRDRLLSYPYLRYEAVQDDFDTTQDLDQIARTEDLAFGTRYLLELGYAAPAFGADRSAGILRAQASTGFRLAPGRSLFVDGALGGRLEDGTLRDTLLSGALRYHWRTSPRTTFFAGLQGDLGHALDADHGLTLGGDSGLRGYPLRYQHGDSRALLTLEERFYSGWSLFSLLDVGAAVFFDAGRVWGDAGIAPRDRLGLLKDVGFGLRLGNNRTALGNVLHLDVAFPLDGDRSISNVQFLVQTQRRF